MKSHFLGIRAVLFAAFAAALLVPQAQASVVVDFDDDAKWVAGSGSITSYQIDHVYADQGLVFTGGPALRQGNGAQDGVAGALGAFSWRLRNGTAVNWTATYADTTALDTISRFSFDVRRWDGNPSPEYSVEYSVNGGVDFTNVGLIDNAFLGDSSDWTTFSHDFGLTTFADGDFVVQLSATTGERIMVDNFRLTAVPEPGSLAVLGIGCGLVAWRRRRSVK
ncbi:PEP-CTERM sorting domain-containing protein [Planctomycetaceae bacterium SH139]